MNQFLSLTLAAVGSPIVVHLVKRDARTTALVAVGSATLIGVAGLLLPFVGKGPAKLLWGALIGLPLLALLVRGSEDVARSWSKSERALRLTLALVPPVLLIGGLEWCAWAATDNRWLVLPTPIKTMYLRDDGQPDEHEDWRVYHMHTDTTKEPDPVLMWKPVAAEPYNEQRFQGPVVAVPKPPDVFRVMAYGDSNTGMPGAWPLHLRRLVERQSPHRLEVINAGVEGYTSYQGLMRFRQERETYQPDMILVSFGWNDVAPAIDKPDKEYLPPTGATGILRAAMRYQSYRLLVSWLRPKPPPRPTIVGNRVSRDDYERNLRAFVDESRRAGVAIVLLTRPHTNRLLEDTRWVTQVPSYNQTVLDVARDTGARSFDTNVLFHGDEANFLPGDDCHLNGAGHRTLALRLCEQLFPVACPVGRTTLPAAPSGEPGQ